jgi:hypothetical protein
VFVSAAVPVPAIIPSAKAATIFPMAKAGPRMAHVTANIAGSVTGDESQNAMTGASGTPAARNPVIRSTVTPHTGVIAPIAEAITIVEAGRPSNHFAATAPAPLATPRTSSLCVPAEGPNITVKFADGVAAEETITAIHDLLRQRHRLQLGREESFLVSDLAEAADVEESATRVVSMLLSAVASVSLIVGGIGIMNIMLVTVTERTREVGLRLAVGARQRDILAQFLVEAMTLALFGGNLGVFFGTLAAAAIGMFARWPVVNDLSSVLLAVGFSACVGIFFGYYPARKAARLQPIEALRAE